MGLAGIKHNTLYSTRTASKTTWPHQHVLSGDRFLAVTELNATSRNGHTVSHYVYRRACFMFYVVAVCICSETFSMSICVHSDSSWIKLLLPSATISVNSSWDSSVISVIRVDIFRFYHRKCCVYILFNAPPPPVPMLYLSCTLWGVDFNIVRGEGVSIWEKTCERCKKNNLKKVSQHYCRWLWVTLFVNPPKKFLPKSFFPKKSPQISNPPKVLRSQISNPQKGHYHTWVPPPPWARQCTLRVSLSTQLGGCLRIDQVLHII